MEPAPIVWLYSKEEYLPSDIGAQLAHTTPEVDYKPIPDLPSPLTLDNLNVLDKFDPEKKKIVYLASKDDISKDPAWLKGVRPDNNGKTEGAKSCCIIVNDKGNGYVDAFFMYFYAYNQGQVVFEKELGDHLGDW